MNSQLISFLFLLLSTKTHADSLRRNAVMLDEVERCVPSGAMYRCFYRGSADTQLTALCPKNQIDTDCSCSMAGRSPVSGFFTTCNACSIGEYQGDWSVTYDCSNLWVEAEEEAEFEAAGFEYNTPAPVPDVTLSAKNTRTSPPQYFPSRTKQDTVASTQLDKNTPKESGVQSSWGSFWRKISWP